LFGIASVAAVSFRDVQHLTWGIVSTIQRLTGCIAMKHTHGDVFMFIGIQKKRGHDFMNACIVKPIQMAGNGIIIEMRSLNAFAQQLR
jgi:hypothetical protein